MGGVLVEGGPLEGVLDIGVIGLTEDVETIRLTHRWGCVCKWCDGRAVVVHLYRRNEVGVFVFDGSTEKDQRGAVDGD